MYVASHAMLPGSVWRWENDPNKLIFDHGYEKRAACQAMPLNDHSFNCVCLGPPRGCTKQAKQCCLTKHGSVLSHFYFIL